MPPALRQPCAAPYLSPGSSIFKASRSFCLLSRSLALRTADFSRAPAAAASASSSASAALSSSSSAVGPPSPSAAGAPSRATCCASALSRHFARIFSRHLSSVRRSPRPSTLRSAHSRFTCAGQRTGKGKERTRVGREVGDVCAVPRCRRRAGVRGLPTPSTVGSRLCPACMQTKS